MPKVQPCRPTPHLVRNVAGFAAVAATALAAWSVTSTQGDAYTFSTRKMPVQTHIGGSLRETVPYVFLADRISVSQPSSALPLDHRADVHGGIKHYRFNGQAWTMDLATGERHLVAGNTQVWSTTPGKYYTFKGYSYYMDPDTGERTQYDLAAPVLPQSPGH